MLRVGGYAICSECVANPVGCMPRVNQSGGDRCSNCNGPFPTIRLGDDNWVVEQREEIRENGIRYEVCTKCADEWEAKNLHLIANTQHRMEKYAC